LQRQICVEGAPFRLLNLRAIVVDVIFETNTGAGA
jgi:hypothetical protein